MGSAAVFSNSTPRSTASYTAGAATPDTLSESGGEDTETARPSLEATVCACEDRLSTSSEPSAAASAMRTAAYETTDAPESASVMFTPGITATAAPSSTNVARPLLSSEPGAA